MEIYTTGLAEEVVWIQFKVEESISVSSMIIAWHRRNARQTFFGIKASGDGGH